MKKFAEFSHEEKRRMVSDAIADIRKKAAPGIPEAYPWIREMYDDRVIVEDGGALYEYSYTVGADGAVTLGDPKEVKVTYEALAELADIEIFEAGTYRGKTYTEDDLDTMVKNFADLKDQIKPVAVIGHDEDQDLLKNSGLFSAGWMTGVRRADKKLLASFKDVPKVLAGLIDKGAFKRISSEIYNDYDGKGLALRRVAILGGEIPEVKTLQDIAALYGETPTGETTWVSLAERGPKSNGKENGNMELTKLQEQVTSLSASVTKLQEDIKAKDAQIASLETEKKDAVTKLSETQKAQKKADIHQYCENLKRDGKLIPAMQDMGIERFMEQLDDAAVQKFAEGDTAEELSPLGFMKKFMERFGKIVRFGELGGAAKTGGKEEKTMDLASFKELKPIEQREFINSGGRIEE